MKIHLKKIIVSFIVILGFVFYAIYQRNGNEQQNFVASPSTTNLPVTQSSSDLVSSTTESQSSSNPPTTLSGNEKVYDYEADDEDDDESYSTQTSQSSANQATSTDTSAASTTTTDTAPTTSVTTTTTTVANALYKDGQYDGRVADAYYGNVQVRAIVQGGKLTDVQFLSYPSDRNQSVEINSYALPILKSEAIKAQSAQVNIVSGATNTSNAFINSLSSALSQAKV
jgi:uncharacterized protein with FMN-binding domain